METPARDIFKGFEPRDRDETWEEWVTRNLKRLIPQGSSTYLPQRVDYAVEYIVPLWPRDQSLDSAGVWSTALTTSGTTGSTVLPDVLANSSILKQVWFDTFECDIEISVVPQRDTFNVALIEPDQIVATPDVCGDVNIKIMLLEFYGTGVSSVFDNDRDYADAVGDEIFVYPNPTLAAMTSAGGAHQYPSQVGWFPRQFASPYLRPLRPEAAIGLEQVYNTTTPLSVVGSRDVGGAPDDNNYVITRGPCSPWEFDVIWEQIIHIPEGKLSGARTYGQAIEAVGIDLGTGIFQQMRQCGRYFERLSIPIKRTVKYNNMDINGEPSLNYYPDRRFRLVAFCDNSVHATGIAAVPQNLNIGQPPSTRMVMYGQLLHLTYADSLISGQDDEGITSEFMELNDADDRMGAMGRVGAKRKASDSDVAQRTGTGQPTGARMSDYWQPSSKRKVGFQTRQTAAPG